MKTVRQLADEIGVSKQAVWQKIKKEPLSTKLETCLTKSGRTIYINEHGEIIVKTAFLQIINDNKVDDIDDKYINTDRTHGVDMLTLLQGELESKNRLIESQIRQLENKDKQIGELTAALENATASLHAAQALHAGTMHKQLGGGPSEIPREEISEQAHWESKKKPGWFARLFGNK